MIEVTQYWNKVIDDDSAPFGTRVLKEYEIKSRYKLDTDFQELRKRYKNHPRMTITDDLITENNGSYYGIHSYTEIRGETPC
jgi:hypothetical protein